MEDFIADKAKFCPVCARPLFEKITLDEFLQHPFSALVKACGKHQDLEFLGHKPSSIGKKHPRCFLCGGAMSAAQVREQAGSKRGYRTIGYHCKTCHYLVSVDRVQSGSQFEQVSAPREDFFAKFGSQLLDQAERILDQGDPEKIDHLGNALSRLGKSLGMPEPSSHEIKINQEGGTE